MNLREGTRRLALLLGVVGALAGGFVSYLELQTTLEQRTRHNRFEQLATSDAVKHERNKLQTAPDFIPAPKQSVPDTLSFEEAVGSEKDEWVEAAKEYRQEQSVVNTGGIRTIHWTKDHGVESIEAEDGQTLYPIPAPSAWHYFLAALFPILGFFIPWGAIRAIGWVAAGFFQPSK